MNNKEATRAEIYPLTKAVVDGVMREVSLLQKDPNNHKLEIFAAFVTAPFTIPFMLVLTGMSAAVDTVDGIGHLAIVGSNKIRRALSSQK